MKMPALKHTLLATIVTAAAGSSLAAVPEQCQTVTLSDPGWTDITATNGIASTVLNALGYQTDIKLLAVPITFEGLKNDEIDVFLGNWMPAHQAFREQYQDDLDVVRKNLEGVKFTLAVPEYVYDAGVQSFADLNRFAKEFGERFYGIDAGSPANQILTSMIEDNAFDLANWRVVESGEQGMLSQVARSVRREKFIVFLGWEPHPMNVNFDLKYLPGGDEYFGPDYGSATIYTITRQGYGEECTNVAQLLENMQFTLDMENTVIAMTDEGRTPVEAANEWLGEHPEILDSWLEGVTTTSGEPGLAAVKQALSM
ncbi:Glycine betaine-binding protein OpuAC precursor [Marinomonas aquimarina]|uniref:Glycine betaine-binding protein OpuAC n=1 Tax=Marinomonas aquimarina TaxID=295068 RepID=A0A1A8T8S9_9GAMM|nr:choline ABC transporter substrate-binding protein [Marinomonas aquimarina]SBS29092.1 Glycine betaine-binding protein OpuAC precursor [Marinomonas aquimarina]